MPEELVLDKPLAIVGDEDVVMGFKGLGFRVYPIKELKECNLVLDKVVEQNCRLCLVQDNIYQLAEEKIKDYSHLPLPIFIPFAKNLAENLLDKILKDIRIKATGAF